MPSAVPPQRRCRPLILSFVDTAQRPAMLLGRRRNGRRRELGTAACSTPHITISGSHPFRTGESNVAPLRAAGAGQEGVRRGSGGGQFCEGASLAPVQQGTKRRRGSRGEEYSADPLVTCDTSQRFA
eukprot:534174-Prorocentrum_minimum.AAC.1